MSTRPELGAASRASLPLMWAVVALASGGCVFPSAETTCPTDARAIYWGIGQQAVRKCPCHPDQEFHGYKPTCWNAWPAGWDAFHADRCPDAACGCQIPGNLPDSEPLHRDETPVPFQWDHDSRLPMPTPATTPPATTPALPADSSEIPAPVPPEPAIPELMPSENGPDILIRPDAESAVLPTDRYPTLGPANPAFPQNAMRGSAGRAPLAGGAQPMFAPPPAPRQPVNWPQTAAPPDAARYGYWYDKARR